MKGLIEEGQEMMEEIEQGRDARRRAHFGGAEGRALRDRVLRHARDVCRDPGTPGRERSARPDARRREGSRRKAHRRSPARSTSRRKPKKVKRKKRAAWRGPARDRAAADRRAARAAAPAVRAARNADLGAIGAIGARVRRVHMQSIGLQSRGSRRHVNLGIPRIEGRTGHVDVYLAD